MTDNLPQLNPVRLPESAPKGIPLAKLIEYRNKGLSYQEIANIVGCSKQNISERLQYFTSSINHLQAVKENRADTLTVVSDTILNSLTPAEIKKAPFGTKITAYGILYDKERLERGQSTENISYSDMVKTRQQAMEYLQQHPPVEVQGDNKDTVDV